MPGRQRNALRTCAICRGEGVGYVAIASDLEGLKLGARASLKDGRSIPCELIRIDVARDRVVIDESALDVWVVVLPLLTCDCVIDVTSGRGDDLRVVFPALRSKMSSRLLTMTKPHVAECLRGIEQRLGVGQVRVQIEEAYAGDGDSVCWRVRAVFAHDDQTATPTLRVFNSNADEVTGQVTLMEDQLVASEYDPERVVRLLTFSCAVPRDLLQFFVVSELANECGGFAGMNPSRAEGIVAYSEQRMLGYEGGDAYPRWFGAHRATTYDLELQRAQSRDDMPEISVVIVATPADARGCDDTISSVLGQSVPPREIRVFDVGNVLRGGAWLAQRENSEAVSVVAVDDLSDVGRMLRDDARVTGTYVCVVKSGDIIEPDALWRYSHAILQQPGVGLLYCDEDEIEESGAIRPIFKVGPNFGRLYTRNYVGNMLMASKAVLRATVPGNGAYLEDWAYDLVLRTFEMECEIVHLPYVLYHRRQSVANVNRAHEAGRTALAEHFVRRKIMATVEDGPLSCTYRVRYALPEAGPKVSIIIPTRDHADLLRVCVNSILERSTYPNFEILLVENNSEEDETFACYDELRAADERIRVVRWKPGVAGEFNYSAIVNFGARQATGKCFVLLNNDTEVIEPAWMEEMLGCLMRPEIGVVGAKLLYKDGLTQHVFMSANPNGDFMHPCQNLKRDALGPGYAAVMPGDCSMVTGACQMMRRSLFESLGGYDERLAVGFNDGDFCLRAADEGYVVTVAAYALLYHREFSSRGRESQDPQQRVRYIAEKAYAMAKHPEFFAEGDPVINPNLDRFNPCLSL